MHFFVIEIFDFKNYNMIKYREDIDINNIYIKGDFLCLRKVKEVRIQSG